METPSHDWDPLAAETLADPIAAYDRLREHCPVAFSEKLGWSLCRHADVLEALHDTATFSSVVSSHLAVPSGMDPPRHTAFRRIVERYFDPPAMSLFEPTCREIARDLVERLPRPGVVELMAQLAHPFALDVQCAFTGWPLEIRDTLREWLVRSQRATLEGDRNAAKLLAQEFEEIVRAQLEERRAAGAPATQDPTAGLLYETVDGRALSLEEITSILRNWTAGELGTIAASIGILARFLAVHPDVQSSLRQAPTGLPAAIEEILRLEAPLPTNRRKVVKNVTVGGRSLAPGERVTLMWGAANRDPEAFPQVTEYRPERDQSANLLWGAGIHFCPGAPLARMELRVLLETMLERLPPWRLEPTEPAALAVYPAAGWATLPIQLR